MSAWNTQYKETAPKSHLKKRLLKYAKENLSKNKWNVYERRLNGWLCNLRFKHTNQAIIEPYIVDTLLIGYNVILEMDGESHDSKLSYDRRRDVYLTNLGYKIIHFRNEEMRDRKQFITKLLTTLNEQRPHSRIINISY